MQSSIYNIGLGNLKLKERRKSSYHSYDNPFSTGQVCITFSKHITSNSVSCKIIKVILTHHNASLLLLWFAGIFTVLLWHWLNPDIRIPCQCLASQGSHVSIIGIFFPLNLSKILC